MDMKYKACTSALSWKGKFKPLFIYLLIYFKLTRGMQYLLTPESNRKIAETVV